MRAAALLTVALVSSAAAAWVPPDPAWRLAALTDAARAASRYGGRGARPVRRSFGWRSAVADPPGLALAALTAAPLIGIAAQAPWGSALTAALAAAGWVLHWRARARWRRGRDRTRAEVAAAAVALHSELRAGRTPVEALDTAAASCRVLEPVSATARVGGDIGVALATAGEAPGADALMLLAAAWRLAASTGVPLSPVAGRMVEAVRDRESLRRTVAGELSSARGTARLLAVLPAATLLLASSLGADLSAVLGARWGQLCLLLGAMLAVAGVTWVDRIAAATDRPLGTP